LPIILHPIAVEDGRYTILKSRGRGREGNSLRSLFPGTLGDLLLHKDSIEREESMASLGESVGTINLSQRSYDDMIKLSREITLTALHRERDRLEQESREAWNVVDEISETYRDARELAENLDEQLRRVVLGMSGMKSILGIEEE
jgi:hypothetical protein